jgi:hypothetical protein
MTKPSVVELTQSYEKWLADAIPVVPADLDKKHEEMAGSILRYVRGTYYIWLDRMLSLLPELMSAPAVTGVGDIHVENFGTWRDAAGIRRWGVNDLDDSGRGSYAVDLVRLATSAVITPHLAIDDKTVCDALFDEWLTAPPAPPVDLDDPAAHHLRRLVPTASAGIDFYHQLSAGSTVAAEIVPESVRDLVVATVPVGWQPTWHARGAGTGSLGHPRFAALGTDAQGTMHAREVKLLGPPPPTWVASAARSSTRGLGVENQLPVEDSTVFDAVMSWPSGPTSQGRLEDWQYRRLSPEDVRIELVHLSGKEAERLLRSMGRALLSVHAIDPVTLRAARADACGRPSKWFRQAVLTMADDCRDGFTAFRSQYHY